MMRHVYKIIGSRGLDDVISLVSELQLTVAGAALGEGVGLAGAGAGAFFLSWALATAASFRASRTQGRKVKPPMKGTSTSGTRTPCHKADYASSGVYP